MKRTMLFIAAIMFCAGVIPAQDIIVLRDGTRIEDVSVQDITDREITYNRNDSMTSIPHNSAEAILYGDGRYETITRTLVGDSTSIAAAESLGYDAQELQSMVANGEDRKMLLWQDNAYPAKCRQAGKKEYYRVFNTLYKPAIKEAKKNGMTQTEAIQKAMGEVFPIAVKAGNEVVRECNGGM